MIYPVLCILKSNTDTGTKREAGQKNLLIVAYIEAAIDAFFSLSQIFKEHTSITLHNSLHIGGKTSKILSRFVTVERFYGYDYSSIK